MNRLWEEKGYTLFLHLWDQVSLLNCKLLSKAERYFFRRQRHAYIKMCPTGSNNTTERFKKAFCLAISMSWVEEWNTIADSTMEEFSFQTDAHNILLASIIFFHVATMKRNQYCHVHYIMQLYVACMSY